MYCISFFSSLISLVLFNAVFTCTAQPLVSVVAPFCKGSSYRLALNCTDPTFTPSDACTTYAPDASVQCDNIPVFFSADKRYQLVFFNASNPEVSWSKGLSIVAMTAFDETTAESGVTQCSFVDVLALQFIEFQSNATNIGQTVISSQYTFSWYSGGKDVDAGIQTSCLNVATPPPPVRYLPVFFLNGADTHPLVRQAAVAHPAHTAFGRRVGAVRV